MIYISRVYGGAEIRGSGVDKAISKMVRLLGPQEENEQGSLDVVMHIPGSAFKPDFDGVRRGRFSKKQRILMIEIGVPARIANADTLDIQLFLLGVLRDAIQLGGTRFEKAGIPYPEEAYLQLVSKLEKQLVH